MNKKIVKKYTFSNEERERLQNIQIGMINAQATLEGLQVFKQVFLENVYKRCGISGEDKKGWNSSITYNLSENVITYTQEEVNKDMVVKK